MISVWKDEGALATIFGENWDKTHIPDGMEKYLTKCQVEHYENIDL